MRKYLNDTTAPGRKKTFDYIKQEAGAKLTIEGHLKRDPALIEMLYPSMDALFGLACLSLTAEGRKAVDRAADREVRVHDGIVTRDTVVEALRGALHEGGYLRKRDHPRKEKPNGLLVGCT